MKLIMILGLFALYAVPSFAQAPLTEWEVTHGPGAIEASWSAVQTSDGGYAVAGQTDVLDAFGDYYLIRLAADGSTLWTQIYGTADFEQCYSVIQKADGGFFLAGTRAASVSQWYIVETNSVGAVVNSAVSTSSDGVECRGAIGTSDGGLLLCGHVYNGTDYDAQLVKLSSSLTVDWTQDYPYAENQFLEDVEPSGSGGFTAIGWTFNPSGYYEVLLMNADGIGLELWRQTYQLSANDIGRALAKSADGGYILTGFSYDFGGSGIGQAFLLKTGSTGIQQWSYAYGDVFADGFDVIESADGGIVVCGYDSDPSNFDSDLWVFKTDLIGQLYWSLLFGDVATDEGHAVLQSTDGGYLATGKRSITFGENQNVYTIKLLRDEDLEGPLAVELSSFDAVATADGIRVNFSTASESENDRFEIWRSTTETFIKIAQLESHGNSSTEQRYDYTDRNVLSGQTYRYFLTDVSSSGARTEHRDRIVSVLYAPESIVPQDYSLTAYPNPFNPTTTIAFSLIEPTLATLNVFDLNGRLVKELANENFTAGAHKIAFEAGELPSGIYLVTLNAGALRLTNKVVLMK